MWPRPEEVRDGTSRECGVESGGCFSPILHHWSSLETRELRGSKARWKPASWLEPTPQQVKSLTAAGLRSLTSARREPAHFHHPGGEVTSSLAEQKRLTQIASVS